MPSHRAVSRALYEQPERIDDKPGEGGKITLKAMSDGLESAQTEITTQSAK